MEIRQFNSITKEHLTLLLDADPAEQIVRDYTKRGIAFEIRQEGNLAGVMVLLPTRPETIEIMNLAVAKPFRGQKLAQALLVHALWWSKEYGFRTVEIGTGSTGVEQLYLYQKCGFRMTHIERDFFVRYYAEEIIENGLVLKDMVRLAQDID
ncbi:N-acetyltransferase [Enterococcus saigonensis]|uniref:N-acetyltransferase n=1 Tax=Enterococcus saigonensis TaxID=1805431 RepID=A0A679IPA8_9ENTE|nr:GNAT family N-acetyltransferase [Enterococcus saigonensis]BCA86721.1 N-acetyltransferase [Enterococcus saigonensis]